MNMNKSEQEANELFHEAKEYNGLALRERYEAALSHPYYCMFCGTQLKEFGLGIIGCPNCYVEFIPFVDKESHLSVSSNKIFHPTHLRERRKDEKQKD